MGSLGREHVDDLSHVEAELADLWREAAEGDLPVMRACTMNLIVVCGRERTGLQESTRMIAAISETVPARALVIASKSPDAAKGPAIDVWVSAHCHRVGHGDTQVCSEQVTIEIGTQGVGLVPGTLLQLLVEEMPVYTLWRREDLAGDPLLEPLQRMSRRVIVDGSEVRDAKRRLRELDALVANNAGKTPLTDVAWASLDPWREAVASMFDAADSRAALEDVRGVEVTAGSVTGGAYLAGWLASRLGWTHAGPEGGWRRGDDQPIRIDVRRDPEARGIDPTRVSVLCGAGDARRQFTVQRTRDGGLALSGNGGQHRIRLPQRDVNAIVCGMLQQTGRDPVFVSSLSASVQLMGN